MGWTTGVQFPAGAGAFLFAITSTPALGPTQASCPVGTRVLSPGSKWPGCELDYSPTSSAEVKNVCGAIPPLLHVFMA